MNNTMVEHGTESAGIRMSGISLSFGGLRALDQVTISAEPGDVAGIIGPNGAGKTTLFNVLCGFVRPDQGEVVWRGSPLRMRPESLVRNGIARTMQAPGLCDTLSVLENVQLGADRHGSTGFGRSLLGGRRDARSERDMRDIAWRWIEEFDLASVAGASPASLPYPQRKRVALARALASDPKLLVLDEPAGGLGESEIDELAEIVTNFSTEDRIVILIEHHMEFVLKVCTRLFALDAGRVIAHGTPEAVVADPAVMEAYLGLTVPQEDQEGTP
jgi:branched-chain amino acid transport system ATP-binding protein